MKNEMKDIVICHNFWSVTGKRDGKKIEIRLKHPSKGSISITEEDLWPIATILAEVKTIIFEEEHESSMG
jgi:hypothetical protein